VPSLNTGPKAPQILGEIFRLLLEEALIANVAITNLLIVGPSCLRSVDI
jgi:hypothetical protein